MHAHPPGPVGRHRHDPSAINSTCFMETPAPAFLLDFAQHIGCGLNSAQRVEREPLKICECKCAFGCAVDNIRYLHALQPRNSLCFFDELTTCFCECFRCGCCRLRCVVRRACGGAYWGCS